jgi:hypothetical protein
MIVARRFIAGCGTSGLRPGGTPEYRGTIDPQISFFKADI